MRTLPMIIAAFLLGAFCTLALGPRRVMAADGPDDVHRQAVAAEQQARHLEQIARSLDRAAGCVCK